MPFEIDPNLIDNDIIRIELDGADVVMRHQPSGDILARKVDGDTGWSVGTDTPLSAFQADEVGGPVAGGNAITDLLGDGLEFASGALRILNSIWDPNNSEIVADVNNSSTITEQIGGEYHHAGSYDGADPDTRLGNALSAAANGDVVLLENAAYSTARTFGFDGVLLGSFSVTGSGGSRIDAAWTLDSRAHIFRGMTTGNGSIAVNASNTHISHVDDADITVSADRAILTGLLGGSVTFESGTSEGVIDSSAATTVTDNGTNTVGDVT